MNKSALSLPKLRFKGFDGKWEKVLLKDIAKIFDGPHKTPKYFNSGIPFYSVETITNNSYKFIDTEQYELFKKMYSPKVNDILFTRIGIIGESKIVEKNMLPFSIYVSICGIRIFSENVYSIFFKYFTKSTFFTNNLLKNSLLNATPIKINIIDMYNLPIFLPSLQEQQKIAHFFSLLDKQIQLWERKLELYELIYEKKLNNLLNDADEEKEINQICLVKKGEQINKSKLDISGPYKYINGSKEPLGYLNQFNSNKNTISICEGGDCGYAE